MKRIWMFALALLLIEAKGAWLDVDVTWEINAPDAWERASKMTDNVRAYSYFADARDLVATTKAFFYEEDSGGRREQSIDNIRGICVSFAHESTPTIYVVNDQSEKPVTVKVDLFGKEQTARLFEHKTKKGIRYQYVIKTNRHCLPGENFGEEDPILISVICTSPEEFTEYKKILETIRRKAA